MATYKAHKFVGLSTPVYLPADIMVEIAIVPASVSNVRSNQTFSGQTSYTQHETANFNAGANADMHKRWLHGGAGGAYVGFNFVVDGHKIIQLTPLNEITWAAGTPDGNRYSWHTELCVNSDINYTTSRRNAAALAAGVIAAKGWTTDRVYQHNIWYGKDCPMLLRRNGLWPIWINQVASLRTMAVAATKGGAVPDTNTLAKGDTAKTIDALNARQGSGTDYKIVTTLEPDTELAIIDGPRSADGYVWYDVKGAFGTGWVASDWLQKIATPKPGPSPDWPYPKPLVPPFWGELMADGATHSFSGGKLWMRSNDLYRVKNKSGTKRLRVVGGDESVGPDLPYLTEFRDAAKGEGYDDKPYVITDGLTRVAMDDLEFVEGADRDALASTLTNVLTDALEEAD